MKKQAIKLILLILLMSINYLFGQSDIQFKEKIDSLKSVLKGIDLQLNNLNERKLEVNTEISKLNQIQIKLEIENKFNKGVKVAINSFGGNLRSTPTVENNLLISIPKGDTILIYNWYEHPFFKASYKNLIGYISSASIDDSPLIKSIVHSQSTDINPRFSNLTRRFGYDNAYKIINGIYWIGMSDIMARESLGSPDDINRSTGSWGIHEQWVYSKRELYLYFENGKLTNTQD